MILDREKALSEGAFTAHEWSGKIGEPDYAESATVCLSSDSADFVTGSSVVDDGDRVA